MTSVLGIDIGFFAIEDTSWYCAFNIDDKSKTISFLSFGFKTITSTSGCSYAPVS